MHRRHGLVLRADDLEKLRRIAQIDFTPASDVHPRNQHVIWGDDQTPWRGELLVQVSAFLWRVVGLITESI